MLDEVYKQLTYLQKQIDNLIKPEIMTVAEIVDLFILGLPHNGRLTLTSGSPVLTTSVTAATTIYLAPYLGNRTAVYTGTGSDWLPLAFDEISVAVPSTVYRPFDIFEHSSSGSLALETVNWNQSTAAITGATNAIPIVITSNGHGLSNNDVVGIINVGGNTAANGIWSVQNVLTNTFELEGSTGSGAYTAGGTWYKLNTTRATAITLQNGRYVKSGDTGKHYRGTGMTTATSGQTEINFSTPGNCLLWNFYNQELAEFPVTDATNHTYTSTTTRIYRNIIANKIGFVVGVSKNAFLSIVHGSFNFDAGDGASSTGLALNRTGNTNFSLTAVRDVIDSQYIVDYRGGFPSAGYNFLQLVQTGNATSPDFREGRGRLDILI